MKLVLIYFFNSVFLLILQVTFLKDTVAKKDEEIEKLRLIKTNINGEKRDSVSPKYSLSSPRRHSIAVPRPSQTISGGKSLLDLDNRSEWSDKHSLSGSQLSNDDSRKHKENFEQSKAVAVHGSQNVSEDSELLGFGEEDSEERLSDISDGGLSMGTETDGSINSIVELTLFPETTKQKAEITEK